MPNTDAEALARAAMDEPRAASIAIEAARDIIASMRSVIADGDED